MNAAHEEDGVVMVEFALVLVPLLLVLVGMLQFGIILNAKIDETHLASSGARYAAVNQNPGEGTLADYIKARANTADMRTSSIVCVEFPPNDVTGTSGLPGDPVKVTMSYAYDLVPFLSDHLDLGTTFTVSGDATMRLEAVPDNIDDTCST